LNHGSQQFSRLTPKIRVEVQRELQGVVVLEYGAIALLYQLVQVACLYGSGLANLIAQRQIGPVLVEGVVRYIAPEIYEHLIIGG